MFTPITTATDENGKTFSVGETWATNFGLSFTIAAIVKSDSVRGSFIIILVHPATGTHEGVYFSSVLESKVTPYSDFKIDDLVWVRNNKSEGWIPRYFARVSSEGHPMVFSYGATSVTTDSPNYVTAWNFCTKIKPE